MHVSIKSLGASWMCKGLVASWKFWVHCFSFQWPSKHNDSNLSSIVALLVTNSLLNGSLPSLDNKVSRWITFTNESKCKCQAIEPRRSFSLKASRFKMHSVSSHKNLGMAKRDFNSMLRLWNQQITSLRSDDPCCTNCHFLKGTRGRHMACCCLHHHDTIKT